MENDRLDRMLYGRNYNKTPLYWTSRVEIVSEKTQGLAFLQLALQFDLFELTNMFLTIHMIFWFLPLYVELNQHFIELS